MGAVAARVRAPELSGRGGWLNTGGRSLSLADLRGRFVLVDFWTGCCVNCLHAIDELRAVEARFADVLTVVGVHSPKFDHEREHATVVAATARNGITHPVLDDPDLRTWDAYTARAWPTLVLVDPAGYIAAEYAGEGHAHAVAALLDLEVPRHEAAGTLRRGPSPVSVPVPPASGLRFPGGAVALAGGTVLVADTGRHALLELAPSAAGELTVEVRRFGDGVRGHTDGPGAGARFAEPQGLCLLPPAVAAAAGWDVVVADTANHAVRGVRLADGAVTTVAGVGTGSAAADPLSSPWDVVWWRDRVWIALAGTHQLAALDPVAGTWATVAGTGVEGLRDGLLGAALFAQPSGLAADPARDRLWLVDAETSAVRFVAGEPGRETVTTVVGTGLFDFGHRDGDLADALLQHPLGIALEPGGTLAVADTYDGAVRRVDPDAGTVRTLAVGLAEPAAVLVVGGAVVVVESTGHRLTRLDPAAVPTLVDREPGRVQRVPTVLAGGAVELTVRFVPPPGQHLDDRTGPATRLSVLASPAALLREGAGTGHELVRRVVLDPAVGDGILHVSAQAASCDEATAGAPNPACHLHAQDWGVQVVLEAGGPAALELVLGGDR